MQLTPSLTIAAASFFATIEVEVPKCILEISQAVGRRFGRALYEPRPSLHEHSHIGMQAAITDR